MNQRRILIFTSSHLCRNPRVLKEATTLGSAGFDVTVLTASTHRAFEEADVELMRDRPFYRRTVDLISRNRSARLGAFSQRAATWIARRLVRYLRVDTAQALGPAHALLRHARRLRADLTIAHNEIPVWAAQYLIGDGRQVAVDLEDWHSEDLLPSDRRSRPITLLRHAEGFALHRAAYVSTTSASLANALGAAYRAPTPAVLRNTFPLQSDPRTSRTLPNRPTKLVWFSQTVGPGRGLESFLTVWGQCPQASHITLLGSVRDGYREELLAHVPPDRHEDVTFLPPVPPDALPVKLAEFDVGLALEARAPLNKDLTISNKILQYLNAGLAVLATGTTGQREVLDHAPGCGLEINPSEPAELIQQLVTLFADPARLTAMQHAARSAAERDFCWETDAARLLDCVECSFARNPGVPA